MGAQFFNIPSQIFPSFLKEIQLLERKAHRFGLKFQYGVVGEENKIIQLRDGKVSIPFKIVKIDADNDLHFRGWKVLAEISRSSEGPLITNLDGTTHRYLFDGTACDHCETNRRRNTVYLLGNKRLQETIQVGSTCLKDFLGHPSAAKIARAYSDIHRFIRDHLTKFEDPNDPWVTSLLEDYGVSHDPSYYAYEVEKFLTLVEEIVKEEGFTSKSEASYEGDSTAFKAIARYHEGHLPSTPSPFVLEALDWAAEAPDFNSDFLKKMQIIARSEYIRENQTGIAAYLIPLYQKHLRDSAKIEKSSWVGEVGDRLEFDVTLVETREFVRNSYSYYDSNWGAVYTFEDHEGNVLVWFSSSDKFWDRKGETFRIRATIRKHDEYRGVKQTSINRVFEVK